MRNTFTIILLTLLITIANNLTAQTTEPIKVTVVNTSTSAHHRIPSIVKLANGNLMAFYDNRYHHGDDVGYNKSSNAADIEAKISNDNGTTWGETMTILKGTGESDDGYKASYGDAATVVDRETGELLLMCAAGANSSYVKTIATENGTKWADPVDITSQITSLRNDFNTAFVTSGHICQSSRIKVGSHYRIYAAISSFYTFKVLVIYSDDFGETWHCLGSSTEKPNEYGSESKLEELPNGDVLLSCRGAYGYQNGRWYNVFTYSNQKTASGSWGTITQSNYSNSNTTQVIGSTADGEVLLVPAKDSNGNATWILLQSADKDARKQLWFNYKELDKVEGFTPNDFKEGWSHKQIATDAAYSTMVLDQNNNIAFLYEANCLNSKSYDIVFQSMSLSYITDGKYTFDSDRGNATDFLAKPLFSANEGEYANDISVEITCATNGATIYYTTDGNEPTTTSKKYTGAINISKTTTLKAIAVKGEKQSEVATTTYKIIVAKPTMSPEPNTFYEPQSITIACATNGATIYYTTDGSEPNTTSKKYTGAISISETTTLKAIAMKGELQSEVATATYNIIVAKPTMSPEPNTFYEPQSITIACATNGATIYYTTDGSEPNTTSKKYTGAISISETTTLKAIAVKGELQSEVATATYTIIEKTEEMEENVKPEDGGVYVFYAKLSSGNPLYVYNNNGTLSINSVSNEANVTVSENYLWVCQKASDGSYYFSSLDGSGYLGLNTDERAGFVTDFNNVLKMSIEEKKQQTKTIGYGLKYTPTDGKSRYIEVVPNGTKKFDRTSAQSYANDKTTLFVFNKVPYIKGGTGCGTLSEPMHHGFNVKFARNDDSYNVASTGEGYNCYATLNLPFTVNMPDGVTAYKIKSLSKKENTAVDIEEYSGTVIPRETPVLLQTSGAKGDDMPTRTISFKPTTAKENAEGTGLAGTLGRQVFTSYNEKTGDSDGNIYYLLGKKDGHVALYYLAANNSGEMAIANNKAYYKYTGGSSAKPAMLTFNIGSAPTAIKGVTDNKNEQSDTWYDLTGRKVTKPSHGIYVHNGKKVVLP